MPSFRAYPCHRGWNHDNIVYYSFIMVCVHKIFSFLKRQLIMSHVLEGVKEFEARWIGWAGVNVPDEIGQKALTKALAEKV